jgi:hypothetical protein
MYDDIERPKKKGDKRRIASAYQAECIAGDDPRLKDKVNP